MPDPDSVAGVRFRPMATGAQQDGESTSDAFGLLGLPRRFDLEPNAIEAAFLARLGGVHPDLVGEEASMDAAALTQAAAVLRDPERRAVHLLALLGGDSASEDRSLPDGFLMKTMELRETVEKELTEGGKARERWTAFTDERRRGHAAKVGALFAQVNGAERAGRAGLLRAVRLELNAWRYTERLIEQLDPGYDPARSDLAGH